MKKIARLLSVSLLIMLGCLGFSPSAHASDDVIDSFTGTYNVREDGVV